MEIYMLPYTIRSRDVNMFQRMRSSQLFELLQEAATDHSELLSAGVDVIRRQNLMWVLARQNVEIVRIPHYGEKVVVETWPGKTVHSLYPRYYRLLDEQGEAIVNSSSIWMLVDMHERSLVSSAQSGIDFSFDKRGLELSLPSPPRAFFTDSSISFTLPFSYVDMNGHMNNTRYFDLADNLSPSALAGRDPARILVEYSAELRLGNSYELLYGQQGDRFFLKTGGDKPLFRIVIDY
ncbi:MAG: hypothetical protein IKD61_04285 [Oscillospiraceae bacterium]|nr:hypothetical protein [Oscillospiraceae bacterium]